MILVDTNVWSEAPRAKPDETVRRWAATNSERPWLSTVVLGELLSGAELMPDGQRKRSIQASYAALVAVHSDRIAPFDLPASQAYAVVLAGQIRNGRSPGTADTQIAATALACGMKLATRNTKHFAGLGIDLIDPWTT